MKRLWTLVVLVGLSGAPLHAQSTSFDGFSDALRNRIESGLAADRIVAEGEAILAARAVPGFYEARGFRPAWFDGPRPRDAVRELLGLLRRAGQEGLDPADYHLSRLEGLLGNGSRPLVDVESRVDADLLLSDAFLVYASHLLQGRVNSESVEPEWLANRRDADFADELSQAVGDRGVAATLASLRPVERGYRQLKDALARLRDVEMEGGWPRVGEGATLRPGGRDPRVRDLRRRLAASGDLRSAARGGAVDGEASKPGFFGPVLEAAVRRFQDRHGLETDGTVGPATLAALNVTVGERIRQIEVNLERWRWLPEDLGRHHIRVNVAGFDVQVWEAGEIALRMRAVVGRAYRQTPMFTGRMTYLVFAPFWHVPPGIAINDKLPLIKQNPGYLAGQRMILLSASTNEPVGLASVDWSTVDRGNFSRRFRLRQNPGPQNALGRVKFMFPNRHNVYLHDTPSRELFARAERSFSSGCIRLERPLDLAEHLLRADPTWTRERMSRVIERGVETSVVLPEAVPVHLLYWTAWVEPDGMLEFRRDIYDRDGRVRTALAADPPGP